MAVKIEFEVFFFDADPGKRFGIFYPAQKFCKGALLYVHPFTEEMNKSRRMVALQAREFAKMGYAVLQIDLYGCGDSEGNLHDASWEIWKKDISFALAWLSLRVSCPFHLWGLRLGANLGMDFWSEQQDIFSSALLWQPILNGESYLTQFLRLAVAGEALRESKDGLTTGKLRQRLVEGEIVEVGGYGLSQKLTKSIETQKLSNWSIPQKAIHWLDVKNTVSNISPATKNVIDVWQSKNIDVNYELINGDQFWMTQEIVDTPFLITASCNYYANASS